MSWAQRHDALYGMGEGQRIALAKTLGYYNWLDVDRAMNAAIVNPVKPNPIVPSAWEYVWPLAWPLLGFIVP
jgi:hypothetical protein